MENSPTSEQEVLNVLGLDNKKACVVEKFIKFSVMLLHIQQLYMLYIVHNLLYMMYNTGIY